MLSSTSLTSSPLFSAPSSSSLSSSPSVSSSLSSLHPNDRDLIETSVIKSLISSYFLIVKKNICDYIPKGIMCFLVQTSKSSMQSTIIEQLYVPSLFSQLLREGEDVSEKRKSCEELIAILKKAMEIINQARDYNTNI